MNNNDAQERYLGLNPRSLNSLPSAELSLLWFFMPCCMIGEYLKINCLCLGDCYECAFQSFTE